MPTAAFTDLWSTPGSRGIEIAADDAADLCDTDGRHSPVVALCLAVRVKRLSALKDQCSHELSSEASCRFGCRCGISLDEAE